MANVVIFGISDFAQLADFYLSCDSDHEVVAFTVHRAFMDGDTFLGRPVIAFEDFTDAFRPNSCKIFAPLSPKRMNDFRKNIFDDLKSLGYEFISYISSKAIYYGTEVGENCFIFEGNVIQPFTIIGNNNIIWSGNHIGHHSTIGNNCFIASHVVISGHVSVGDNCFLGVNSTISNGLSVADYTFVGAGALITRSTSEYDVYLGPKGIKSDIPSNKLRGI